MTVSSSTLPKFTVGNASADGDVLEAYNVSGKQQESTYATSSSTVGFHSDTLGSRQQKHTPTQRENGACSARRVHRNALVRAANSFGFRHALAILIVLLGTVFLICDAIEKIDQAASDFQLNQDIANFFTWVAHLILVITASYAALLIKRPLFRSDYIPGSVEEWGSIFLREHSLRELETQAEIPAREPRSWRGSMSEMSLYSDGSTDSIAALNSSAISISNPHKNRVFAYPTTPDRDLGDRALFEPSAADAEPVFYRLTMENTPPSHCNFHSMLSPLLGGAETMSHQWWNGIFFFCHFVFFALWLASIILYAVNNIVDIRPHAEWSRGFWMVREIFRIALSAIALSTLFVVAWFTNWKHNGKAEAVKILWRRVFHRHLARNPLITGDGFLIAIAAAQRKHQRLLRTNKTYQTFVWLFLLTCIFWGASLFLQLYVEAPSFHKDDNDPIANLLIYTSGLFPLAWIFFYLYGIALVNMHCSRVWRIIRPYMLRIFEIDESRFDMNGVDEEWDYVQYRDIQKLFATPSLFGRGSAPALMIGGQQASTGRRRRDGHVNALERAQVFLAIQSNIASQPMYLLMHQYAFTTWSLLASIWTLIAAAFVGVVVSIGLGPYT